MSSSDPDRLVKLVRVLSSDKDGEVLGAVRAIERILKSNGFSFHDLAESLAGRILEVVKVEIVEKEVVVDRTQKDWIEAADKLMGCIKLTPRELEFVSDMRTRFRLKPEFEPTQRQMAWFADLYKKHVTV
jgi:hypothetical protein